MGALAEGPHPATSTRVVLTGPDDVAVDAIVARPDDGEAGLGVVVHPDLMGVRPLFEDLCRRVATHGYIVCCPEPFARAPADVRAAEDPSVRMGFIPSLDDDLQVGDLIAAADETGVADVAVIGFCMGGMQALKTAATPRFRRAVDFYGMIRLPAAWRGPRLRDPLDTASRVCPTLAIFGGADPFTPTVDIDALRDTWKARDDCEIVMYPDADHGFVHAPERPAHRPDDASDAWRRALAFLAH